MSDIPHPLARANHPESPLTRPLTIHIDGASRGNPGPSAVGILIRGSDGKEIKRLSEYIGHATNNTAEYMAFIFALQESLYLKADRIEVFTDSELLARQFAGEYRVKDALIRLFQKQIKHLMSFFSNVSVRHIPREENSEADRLANRAIEEML